MNLNEQEIERLLRHAPKPQPPSELKKQLSDRVQLSADHSTSKSPAASRMPGGWLRRWWPALAPATASLACAVVLTFQQIEIRSLQESIRALSQGATTTENGAPGKVAQTQDDTPAMDPAVKEQEEIARLKQLAAQLAAEIAQLEQTQKENESLRTQLTAPPTLTQEELDALAEAKERAQSVSCINNLKQVGLAVRLWELDNAHVTPPDFLSMSNELNTPKILVCPGQTNNTAASSWATYTSANSSYEYLTPSATNADVEPTRVLTRCPTHGHIGLCDGSVQGKAAKTHPEWLVERDGKLYLENNAPKR